MNKAKVLRKLEKAEEFRVLLERKLRDHDIDRFSRKESNGGWSLLQVLEHIIVAEELTLKYVRYKSQRKDELKPPTLKTRFRFGLYFLVLKTNLKFKAPKAVSDPITGEVPFEALMTRWNAVRQRLLELLEQSDSRLLEQTVYKNPIAGRGHFGHAIKMIELHPRHHMIQINRLLYEYGD